MDTDVKLISGGIYKTNFSEEPIRILRFDDIEVFYDSYWSSLNKWSLASSLKRSGAYYRLPTDFFLKNTTFLRHQPLTIEEINTFRPDLPNRLCRNKQMYWTDKVFDTLDDYKSYAAQFGCDTSDNIVLPVHSITLEPFGAKGRVTSLKSKVVTSIDKNGFSCIELLWLANNIQAEHSKHIADKGVGIYRSGHSKKVPSYYIWGYYDKADNIPKEE